MSQYLIYDQKDYYQKAKTIKTEVINHDDFELIFIEDKPRAAAKIRLEYYRQNLDPLDKAMEKGAAYVRAYYNDKNLRKRKL